MNPLRIFARLRELEESAALHFTAITGLAKMADDDRKGQRPLFRALHRRLERIETGTTACARCRNLVRVDQMNEPHGPRFMEGMAGDELRRIVVCEWCELGAKRDGWTLVKIETPAPPTLVPAAQQESPS